jgi:hypothetical protein
MVQRIVGRLALVLGLVAASVVFTGGVASAGGPTSVLISSSSTERATAIYHSHPSYNVLDAALHNGKSVPAPAREQWNFITATWLIHDISIWRIDRIHLDAPGGPLVGTQDVGSGEPLPPGLTPGQTSGPTISWRQVNDGTTLRALLDELGIIGSTPPARTAAPVPAGASSLQPPAAEQPPAADTGWWWGAAGLVAGVAATLLVTRGRRRTAPADPDEPALVVQDHR